MRRVWNRAFSSSFVQVQVQGVSTSFPAQVVGEQGLPGVIVVQEWWGINQQIKDLANRLAFCGYRTLIPDLYRGKIGVNAEEASHLMTNLNFPGAVQDIKASQDFLRNEGSKKIAVVGFCMGGALALAAAGLIPSLNAAICCYGVPGKDLCDPSKIKVPIQCHFGNLDSHVGFSDPSTANALEQSLKEGNVSYEFHRYDGLGHGFFNDLPEAIALLDSLGSKYDRDPESIDLAWSRVYAFLKQHLTDA